MSSAPVRETAKCPPAIGHDSVETTAGAAPVIAKVRESNHVVWSSFPRENTIASALGAATMPMPPTSVRHPSGRWGSPAATAPA